MYKIVVSRSAIKQLKEIPSFYARQIRDHIDDLAHNPRPPGYKKLKGHDNEYRVRVGVYRILYNVFDDIVTVEVIAIGHRKDVYN